MKENPLFETAKCTQLGILVHDIEKSSQAYAAFLGVPVPPVQMTGVYEDAHTTYLGQPTKARCKQAFFYYGDLEVELLEPDHEPSVWRQALDENGEGLHHVAFRVQGMDEMIRRGESQGMKLLQRGRWATGHFAYLDATEFLHVIIELLENGQFEV